MIRVKELDKDVISSVMSCLFNANTTSETYVFYNHLKTLLDTTEVVDEIYLIYSAIDTLYELYSIRRDIPVINKEIVLSIIKQSLYSEIKEVHDPGFKHYAKMFIGSELDSLNDGVVQAIGVHVTKKCEEFIDQMVVKNYSVEESRGYLSSLTQNYVDMLSRELSNVVVNLNNSDSRIIDYQYYGWKKFLRKYKIFNGSELPKLLRVVASLIESKLIISSSASDPLTTIGQLIALKEKYLQYDEPLGSWGDNLDILDSSLRIVPGTYTLVVGAAGIGKTTLGSWLAANLMAQGVRVMFYSPEIRKHMLLMSHVLPAYMQAMYGFRTNVNQILGTEPVYAAHDTLSQEARTDLLRAGELSLAESGLFYHIDTHFQCRTLIDEMRKEIIKFEPDVIIFDHTTEIRGEENLNIVTQQVAEMFETIKNEYPIHIMAFSHTGSNFTVPTQDHPIVREKICNWSKRLEGAADNVVGMFRVDNKLNIFNTKSRWAELFPMWISLDMDREHNWFSFNPNAQIGARLTQDVITDFISDQKLYGMEVGNEDEDDSFKWEEE